MRQKALGGEVLGGSSSAGSKHVPPSYGVAHAGLPKAVPSASVPPAKLKHASPKTASPAAAHSPPFANKFMAASAIVASAASALSPPKPPVPDEESYPLTDSEDEYSDCSDSDSRAMKKEKLVPDWARPEKLSYWLHYQYTSGDPKLDPDYIFGDFSGQTCDLEEVFGGTKDRYKRRGSSGNWTADRLTEREKHDFKRRHHHPAASRAY
jgi:hypothetical protein